MDNLDAISLTKTDFIHFLNCQKSLWLLKRKPEEYPQGEFSVFAQKLTEEGYEVERYVQRLLKAKPDVSSYSFQEVYKTSNGLFARADVVRNNEDGTINIYEVKSSTSVKDKPPHNQVKDAAFQTIAAEIAGHRVSKVFIIHLNGDFVREGDIDPSLLLTVEDVTGRVRDLIVETKAEIQAALDLLSESKIDESFCSCLYRGRGSRCDTFDHFNKHVPKPSIYDLPRLHKNKLALFADEGRFALSEVDPSEVSETQALVLSAAHEGKPIVNIEEIRSFFEQVSFPIYFLDYETYSSAIPIVDGIGPQYQLPFQFSLHVRRSREDEALEHYEYLSETAQLPLKFIEKLERLVGDQGSIISWHKSFENTRNAEMAVLYPQKAAFLQSIVERTLDLEDVFKKGYVDIQFGGSTSIKNVLPIIVPDLTYKGMRVSNGTEAMNGWLKLLNQPPGVERDQLRSDMLEYCELDTLAMVRIFDAMRLLT